MSRGELLAVRERWWLARRAGSVVRAGAVCETPARAGEKRGRHELRDAVVPASLLALSLVPVVAGASRVLALGTHPASLEGRFVASPFPFVVHAVAATVYALVGALQFSRTLRLRWPASHRRVGYVAWAAGLVTAASGLWMAQRYAIPTPVQGPLLHAARLVVGTSMLGSLLLGVARIRRHDLAGHEAWMVRAYALGQGAGTQALLLGPWTVAIGEVQGLPRDVLMTLAWVLNAAAAEWIVRRSLKRGAAPVARRVAVAAP